MRLDQSSVCNPHHLLELPELAQEPRVSVVHLLCVFGERGMGIGFNVPNTVWQRSTSSAGNLLLIICPVRKLDLVREQDTASHNMNKAEFCLNSPQSLLGLFSIGHGGNNLHAEPIIGVTWEALVSISRHLELPVHIGHRRPLVMRVNPPVGHSMVKLNNGAVFDVTRSEIVPSIRTLDLSIGAERLRLVLKQKNVVLIFVGVQGDLLLLASSGIHMEVGVKVATLSVEMTEADAGAKGDVGGNILHGFGVQCRLELGRHETISLAGVHQT